MIENIGAYSQVDYDRGYQQGRADAIEEFAKALIDVDWEITLKERSCEEIVSSMANWLRGKTND